MLTLIFGIRASEPPPRAWRTTEKAGPDRIKERQVENLGYKKKYISFSIAFEGNMSKWSLNGWEAPNYMFSTKNFPRL